MQDYFNKCQEYYYKERDEAKLQTWQGQGGNL